MFRAKSIEQELPSILGGGKLRPAESGDAVCGVMPRFVAEPETERQLAAALAFAGKAGVAVVPRGGGTKLDWGNPPKKAELILSTVRLNRVLEHAWADLTVTVEAGCTLQSLQRTLAQHGQRLAFDGLWPEGATVGGVLSTNDSGALRLRFGALRDLIIGVTLALPDGTLASSGGKVVKNVAGYDLPKLSTGALGTLGVITRAVFRLHPLPRTARTFSFPAENFPAIQRHVLAIQDSKLAHTALQVRCEAGGAPRADILFEATDAGLTAQESHLRELLGVAQIELTSHSVWNARQAIWDSAIGIQLANGFREGTASAVPERPQESLASAPEVNESHGATAYETNSDKLLLAKIVLLPSDFAKTFEALKAFAESRKLHWQSVVQATGIGMLRLEGESAKLSAAAERLREEVQGRGGSFVILRRPPQLYSFDAWGKPGDAVSLMRAVKHQLDPNGTLNPGRFVEGI